MPALSKLCQPATPQWHNLLQFSHRIAHPPLLITSLQTTCTMRCRICSVPAIKDAFHCPAAENTLLKLRTQTCSACYSTVLLKNWPLFNDWPFTWASGSLTIKMFQKLRNRRLAFLSKSTIWNYMTYAVQYARNTVRQHTYIHTYSDSNRTGNFNDFDGWWTKVKIFR